MLRGRREEGFVNELISPIRKRLQGRHLIFVPHDLLHHLPFGALFDGERYLIDSFSVSYAPSASIYALCHDWVVSTGGASLFFAISRVDTPDTPPGIHSVAVMFP